MRWIEPGTFQMGSPDSEDGRYSDEGPQHEVRLTKGFWLGDTPVTQALWTAAMGNNPSHFKDPKRPVESVSWDDVQQFLNKMNARVPGIGLGLPTEAQWEYACRAGTEGANYARGGQKLADIAWFGENSGGQTHPVATKPCNDWGLYDMLGNVWEWCADGTTQLHCQACHRSCWPPGWRLARAARRLLERLRQVRARGAPLRARSRLQELLHRVPLLRWSPVVGTSRQGEAEQPGAGGAGGAAKRKAASPVMVRKGCSGRGAKTVSPEASRFFWGGASSHTKQCN